MKKLFEKKQWLMLTMVAVLGVAVYLNYYFTQEPGLSAGSPTVGEEVSMPEKEHLGDASFVGATPEGQMPAEPATEGYFDNARAARKTAREESVRLINETLAAPGATAEQQSAAEKQTAAIAEHILQESNVESLILAKGFTDCVVFLEEDTCQVVVDAPGLTAGQTVQILEIVLSQTAVEAKNVQITAPQTENGN